MRTNIEFSDIWVRAYDVHDAKARPIHVAITGPEPTTESARYAGPFAIEAITTTITPQGKPKWYLKRKETT